MSANTSPTMADFARTPRLPRMRSQRIVHVVQTEEDDAISVSVVTISKDGHTEETREALDFSHVHVEDQKEQSHEDSVSDKDTAEDLMLFEVDLNDTTAPQLTPCEWSGRRRLTHTRSASLFSNDEFEPIRMTLPKRRPQPLHLSSHELEQPQEEAPVAPESPSSIYSSECEDEKTPSHNTNLSDSPTLCPRRSASDTSASSSSFFSVVSATSSSTCVAANDDTKFGGHIAYKKHYGKSPKIRDVVFPEPPSIRGLVDLRVCGYDFGWSRLVARSDAAHGLSPEDAAELEIFLSKSPNVFAAQENSKQSPKKRSFEKKLFDVLKLLK